MLGVKGGSPRGLWLEAPQGGLPAAPTWVGYVPGRGSERGLVNLAGSMSRVSCIPQALGVVDHVSERAGGSSLSWSISPWRRTLHAFESPKVLSTIEPPGEKREQEERTGKKESNHVRAYGRELLDIDVELLEVRASPALAVALLHQQRHQAVDVEDLTANPVALPLDSFLNRQG